MTTFPCRGRNRPQTPRETVSFRDAGLYPGVTAAPAAASSTLPGHDLEGGDGTMPDYVVIATWPFGQTAVKTALPLLAAGKPALDAALAGAQAVEDDPKVHSVGYGGLANAIGTVQLDACVMDGKTLACGAVAALENVRHAAALARRVMEKTPHVLLVGEGAGCSPCSRAFRWTR